MLSLLLALRGLDGVLDGLRSALVDPTTSLHPLRGGPDAAQRKGSGLGVELGLNLSEDLKQWVAGGSLRYANYSSQRTGGVLWLSSHVAGKKAQLSDVAFIEPTHGWIIAWSQSAC